MPRIASAAIPGVPHHVTQRGNNRQDVFFVDDDRSAYLDVLRDQSERFGFRLVGYCLMTNHVHLIGIPEREDSLAKAVGRTHWLYTQQVNRLHARSGHLWQNRFHSCPLDHSHLWAAMCYVERNPVRAKLVRRAWRHAWSSALSHVRGEDRSGLVDCEFWRAIAEPSVWREALVRRDDEGLLGMMRLRTRTGRPLGSDSFMSKVESFVGRRLRPLPVGRPRTTRKCKATAMGRNR